MQTELDVFIAMLERAGIGHGLRVDADGTAVQVELDDEGYEAEFKFGSSEQLQDVSVSFT